MCNVATTPTSSTNFLFITVGRRPSSSSRSPKEEEEEEEEEEEAAGSGVELAAVSSAAGSNKQGTKVHVRGLANKQGYLGSK